MKISRISVYQVDLPLEYPYWLSGGRLKFECLDATLVKIETDEGMLAGAKGHHGGTPMFPHMAQVFAQGSKPWPHLSWDWTRAVC